MSVWMTFGFHVDSKHFRKLFSVSWEVYVLHGWDWIHRVARSCTTTAYRWLFRDSQLLLRTLWSAVIKTPKFSARGTAVPARLLQEALVNFVLKQMSQFRSFGKRVKMLCLLGATLRRWRWFTRRTRGCVPVSLNTFIHKIFRKLF